MFRTAYFNPYLAKKEMSNFTKNNLPETETSLEFGNLRNSRSTNQIFGMLRPHNGKVRIDPITEPLFDLPITRPPKPSPTMPPRPTPTLPSLPSGPDRCAKKFSLWNYCDGYCDPTTLEVVEWKCSTFDKYPHSQIMWNNPVPTGISLNRVWLVCLILMVSSSLQFIH